MNIFYILTLASLVFFIGYSFNDITVTCVDADKIETLRIKPHEYVKMVNTGKSSIGYVYDKKIIHLANCKATS